MKKDLLTEFVELQKEELAQLCNVVKETVATNIVFHETKAKKKSYGINDMWNLRRSIKTAGGRTRFFYVRG